MTIQSVPEAGERNPAMEREALTRELLKHQRGVFLLCLGFTGNSSDARDMTQETFARALSRLDRAPAQALRPWLLRIARNACIDGERRKKIRRIFMPRLGQEVQEAGTPDRIHALSEEIARVRRAIRSLPQPLREVLVLREYGELSYTEIAAALGLKQGTVMSRLNRARAAVLHRIKEEIHGQSER